MTMNMSDWQNQLIQLKKRVALPIMTHPGIAMIGKQVIDAVTHGEIHYQAIRMMSEKFPSVASTMIMDLTVEAEAFGSVINFSDHEVPSVTGRLVSNMESVNILRIPDLRTGRVQEYLNAARLTAENIRHKPVFGGCIGPFSLAGRLYGMSEIMTDAYMEHDTVIALLEKCTAFLSLYISEMKHAGINGIIIAEPAAGLLDESLCEALSSAYIKQLTNALQDDHFTIILHNCGNTGHVTKSMINTGARALHFGNRINMTHVLHEVPSDILVLGNLDPVGVFKMATPAVLKQEVHQLLESTADFPNFILSSGCDTPPGVSPENISAFYEALDEYNCMMATINRIY
jgi:uroporphyrinogen decarboxylase